LLRFEASDKIESMSKKKAKHILDFLCYMVGIDHERKDQIPLIRGAISDRKSSGNSKIVRSLIVQISIAARNAMLSGYLAALGW